MGLMDTVSVYKIRNVAAVLKAHFIYKNQTRHLGTLNQTMGAAPGACLCPPTARRRAVQGCLTLKVQ